MPGSRLLDSLPLASAAYPVLDPAEQRFAMEHGDRITLADASAFLHSEGVHSELRRRFGTAERRVRLHRALDGFEKQLQKWVAGHRQSPRVAWLVPVGDDYEDRISWLYRALLECDDYATFCRLHELLRLPNAPRWTPFVSVESIRLAASVTRGHRLRLERAFARGLSSLGLPPDLRPWSSDDPQMGALPTSWLYQFEPARELGALISRGYRAGLVNVGHFAMLDPAVQDVCSPRTASHVGIAVATRERLGG
jgi:hypothetical protein